VFAYWSVCFVIRSIFFFVGYDFLKNQDELPDNDFGIAIALIINFIVTECLPYLLCLEANFFEVFTEGFVKRDEDVTMDQDRQASFLSADRVARLSPRSGNNNNNQELGDR